MKKIKMIETYLDGSLHGEEREKLKEQLVKDEELSSEVELHRDINEAIMDDETFDFRKIITTLSAKKDTGVIVKRGGKMKYLKYPVAAAILLLIGLSLFHILSFKSPQELYTVYYKPYQSDISTRSVINSADKIQLSYILYQEGNYEVSYGILKNYLKKNTDPAARFYFALNAIELNETDIAISELLTLEDNTFTPFALHARWYLAMLYLKKNEAAKAEKYLNILAAEENMYRKRAKNILNKLRS